MSTAPSDSSVNLSVSDSVSKEQFEPPTQKKDNTKHGNPWSRANPLSILFFSWIWPIFKKGLNKDLEQSDLYPTPESFESERLSDKFTEKWKKELKIAKEKGREPKLFRVLLQLCKRNLIFYFLVLGFDELVVRVVQPITLRMLVKSFGNKSDISRRDQIIYGAAVCLCTFVHNFIMEHCVYLMLKTGLMCRVSCSSILFQKIMRLSPFARKEATTGRMMNLMSNDLGRFDIGLIFLGYTILAPLQVLIFFYFLWIEIGSGTLGGMLMILIIMPLQVVNGNLTTKFRENIAKQTDERSRVMNELVLAVRVIKMMAWENPFSKLVQKIRKTEVKALGNKMYLKGFYLSMYTVCIKLTPFLSILLYVLIGNRITADKAFFIVAVFQIIIENMVYYFSLAVAGAGEIWIAIQRIQDVLLMEEQNEDYMVHQKKTVENKLSDEVIVPKIKMVNASAKWGKDEEPTISNFNIEVQGAKLVMVIGAVGSGKSSFLHTLISELPLSAGTCEIEGEVTYASQEAWLFAGTVRENILFGKPFDKTLYYDVVRASALEDDLKQLSGGDMTVVGDRGMSLSGGQKARINLARALYRNNDIVLLDDPLSAVDSRVSRHIFDKCIRNYLSDKLIILATHQLQYLSYVDHVIVLKSGQILAQGTPSEIQALNLDLTSLIEGEDGEEVHEGKATNTSAHHHEADADDLASIDEEELEAIREGTVGFKTYWAYLRSGDSIFGLTAVILLFCVGQIIITCTDYWLSLWTNAEETSQNAGTEALDFESPYWKILNPNNYYGDRIYLTIYGTLISIVIVVALIRATSSFRYFLQISVNLHNRMFNSLIRAPTQFFDDNPSGRIMTRFTKDIGAVDELLPPELYDSVEYILQCCGVVVVVVLSNYYLSVPSLIIVLIILSIRHVFLKTSRDLKRIESHAKGPVFSHLASSIQGMTTIRALKGQTDAIVKFDQLQDIHSSPWFLFLSAIRCFTVWVGTMSAVFLTAITVTFLILSGSESVLGGLIGFVLSSTIILTTNLQWALREAAEAENYMTSVARCMEYTVLPSENAWESEPSKRPPSDWPSAGGIKFNNVVLTYGDNDVLKNLTFEIKPKEKIGIVGRTGAGKSSIITALFRLTEPKGEIIIDGIRINDIGLHELRKQISIIPQDPVLFSGSIRYNLDPFNQFADEEIWQVIEEVKLKEAIEALDEPVEDGGANFSIGERQLLCLARAILRKNKIIVMDEATANVDPTTDAFIQQTIREKFRDCTIIVIAHRLLSVMDCNRILGLELGRVKEFDHPHILLQNKEGFLYQLVSFVGEAAGQQLKKIARKHYEDTIGAKMN